MLVLFLGRKGKEHLIPKPHWPLGKPFPNITHWIPDDEELLQSITKEYIFNWDLIADSISYNKTRIEDVHLPYECYLKWMQLNSQPIPAPDPISNSSLKRKDNTMKQKLIKLDNQRRCLKHFSFFDQLKRAVKRRDAKKDGRSDFDFLV